MTEEAEGLVKQIAQKVAEARLVRFGYDRTLEGPSQRDWLVSEANDLMKDIVVVLEELAGEGLLLPPGGHTRLEFGLEQHAPGAEGILMIGTGMRAQAHATHQREVTVWPSEGPNDYWARYVTLWEPVTKEDG